MRFTETQEILKNTILPVPTTPVPVNIEIFPGLCGLIKERTLDLPNRLNQLSHYYITTKLDAYRNKFSRTPANIAVDENLPVEMFVGFGGEFDPFQDSLALSSGLMKPLIWDNTELGTTFTLTQFQTAIFDNGGKLYTVENEMYVNLGFFDWRAVLIEYYKQSFAYLRETRAVHPPYLSVEVMRFEQLRKLREKFTIYSPFNENKRIEEQNKIKANQRKWLSSLGFVFTGSIGLPGNEVMFLDIRDIPLNPHFASMMQGKMEY